MRIRALLTLSTLAGIAGLALAEEDNWTRWRGTDMSGIARESNPPLQWSEDRNVKWKVALPGHGSSTPVIWGEHLFVLTAVPVDGSEPPLPPHADADGTPGGRRRRGGSGSSVEQEFKVLAIRRADGSIAWERTAGRALPHEGKQQNNSYASASAITDGEILLAYFGSWGLYAYDLEGNPKWSEDFGDMSTRNGFGEGASPALHGDSVVVQWDHEGVSFIASLDKGTGRELWRRERDEVTSWATPLVVEHDGRTQVIATGTKSVTSYDLATGDVIWHGPGLTLNAIPTSVHEDGVVYLTSGYRGNAAYAVRLADAKGDIAGSSAILWQVDRDTPYVPSPLLFRDVLYLVKSNNAILTALDPASGATHYGPTRLEGIYEIYASPVAVSDHVIVLGRDGNAVVLASGPEYEVVHQNSLEDGFDASPAFVDDEMYLRGYRYLYRISAD